MNKKEQNSEPKTSSPVPAGENTSATADVEPRLTPEHMEAWASMTTGIEDYALATGFRGPHGRRRTALPPGPHLGVTKERFDYFGFRLSPDAPLTTKVYANRGSESYATGK